MDTVSYPCKVNRIQAYLIGFEKQLKDKNKIEGRVFIS